MRSFYPFVLAAMIGTSALAPVAQNPTPSRQGAQTPRQPSAVPVAKSAAQPQQDTQPVPEPMPVTVQLNSGRMPRDSDPLMGVPPLPKGKTSLIGGRVSKIDDVRNHLTVKIFGGGKWDVAFDDRTHFYRDGVATTFAHVQKGDRVYVDTMLDGHHILARNVRVVTHTGEADARGQVLSFNNDDMSLRDELSAQAVNFRVSKATEVLRDGQRASLTEVQPGSLISVKFMPGNPDFGVAKQIQLLAAPGQDFRLEGKVTHLDLSTGVVSVENHADSRIYDVTFNRHGNVPSDLMVGSEVSIAAVFDGRHYRANQIQVTGQAR